MLTSAAPILIPVVVPVLDRARARGRRFALDANKSSDNLGLLEARAYTGRNERATNEERQKGEFHALLPPDMSRGFRYPKWAQPDCPKAALRPFVDANPSRWVIRSLMVSKRDVLHGKAGRKIILDVVVPFILLGREQPAMQACLHAN
ncbi:MULTISPECIES: hypothetical protein [Paraburkholderia]|uniref:hypothetical protein n=1 Tax=Paraburkholderia TaxID=1822464 RepID=UPI0013A6893E|nr:MULTISPECIES: hypothetical protein [Paraburkholderia]MDH6148256.1 hypothetical protein [Paraburkholderia sp. WSM4179]